MGIGAEVVHAADYTETQQMMLDLFDRHPAIAGVQYRSRWDNGLLCYALFDRAQAALHHPESHWLADPGVIGPTLNEYAIEIV